MYKQLLFFMFVVLLLLSSCDVFIKLDKKFMSKTGLKSIEFKSDSIFPQKFSSKHYSYSVFIEESSGGGDYEFKVIAEKGYSYLGYSLGAPPSSFQRFESGEFVTIKKVDHLCVKVISADKKVSKEYTFQLNFISSDEMGNLRSNAELGRLSIGGLDYELEDYTLVDLESSEKNFEVVISPKEGLSVGKIQYKFGDIENPPTDNDSWTNASFDGSKAEFQLSMPKNTTYMLYLKSTSINEKATKNYEVVIDKAEKINQKPKLRSLEFEVDEKELSFSFNPAIFNYSLGVSKSVTSIMVQYEADNSSDKIECLWGGEGVSCGELNWDDDGQKQTLRITLSNEINETTTYTVEFKKMSGDVGLESLDMTLLSMKNSEADKYLNGFDSLVYSYFYEVDSCYGNIKLTPSVKDGCTVYYDGHKGGCQGVQAADGGRVGVRSKV